MNTKQILALFLGIGMLSGCEFRSTTTARSAIEEALLSEAAVRSTAKMDFGDLKGKSFFIKEDRFEATDGKFVLGQLRNQLLTYGLTAAVKEDDADLLVYPRSGAHAIDESDFLLGMPALPIPIPAVGTFKTPELALFKLARQRGRDWTGVEVDNRKTGELAKDTGILSGQARYDRWTILIFIGFTTTDLGRPF